MNETFVAQRIINTDEDCYDVMYWSIKFGVSIERLIEAVSKVGPLVMNVERYLLGASTPVMADSLVANSARYVIGQADSRIVQPDPTVFAARRREKDRDDPPLPARRTQRRELTPSTRFRL
jgi:hypothetical protein